MPPTSARRLGDCALVVSVAANTHAAAANPLMMCEATALSPEREQNVAADAASELRIPRRHEQHSAGDHRTSGVDRPAARRYAVDRGEFACGVELPERVAVRRRIGVDDAGARS